MGQHRLSVLFARFLEGRCDYYPPQNPLIVKPVLRPPAPTPGGYSGLRRLGGMEPGATASYMLYQIAAPCLFGRALAGWMRRQAALEKAGETNT